MHATVAEDMLLHMAKASLPSPLGRDRAGGHPSTQRRANRRKQTKNGGEPSGLEEQEEDRGSPGQWVHLMNASGLENGNGRGRPKEAMRGMEGQSGGGERAVMQLGTNLLLLYQILSQSIGVC